MKFHESASVESRNFPCGPRQILTDRWTDVTNTIVAFRKCFVGAPKTYFTQLRISKTQYR